MTIQVRNKQSGKVVTEAHNLSGVDDHEQNKFVLWFPNDDGTKHFGRYEVITVNSDEEWLSVTYDFMKETYDDTPLPPDTD